MKAILRSGFLVLAIMAMAVPASAGPYEDGKAAYERGDYAAALKYWRPLAELGHAQAMFNLGVMYRDGRGVPQDYAEAKKWYRRAAEKARLPASAGPYEDGKAAYERGDYAAALKYWRPLAELGHARAMFNLGVMYRDGRGVPQDYAEAVKWLRKAAEQGHANAQNNLGIMYYYGRDVPKDYAEAVKWYRKAAEQGDASAQFRLGVMYAKGLGVPRDFVQAHMWLNLAGPQFKARWKVRQELKLIVPEMTPDQITEAQRMAREWMAKHQR
jgi:TPR repeat protein